MAALHSQEKKSSKSAMMIILITKIIKLIIKAAN